MKNKIALPVLLLICLIGWRFAPKLAGAEDYDVVILNGRVMDPESKLDAVRNIGITGGSIREITERTIQGKSVIDAKGLVVAFLGYSGDHRRRTVTGAPAHIVHIDSMGLTMTPKILQMLAEVRAHGIDISADRDLQ